MSNILFLCYPKCDTCRKAAKWLENNGVEVENRLIAEDNPTKEELSKWVELSGLPLKKFFNTSGKLYKENNIKEIVQTADADKLLTVLASDGMMVKRPILVKGKTVLVGFNEEEWAKSLK